MWGYLLDDTALHSHHHDLFDIYDWGVDCSTERSHSVLYYHSTPVVYARTLTAAIARPAARDESSAHRAIAKPAPTGVNTSRAPVAAG